MRRTYYTPALVFIATFGPLGIATFMCIVGSSRTTSWQTVIGGGIAGGISAANAFWCGSSRIRTVGHTLVQVDNYLIVRTVQADAIATIERNNGLQLTLDDGRKVRSLAFGPSLFALVTGNRRSRKTAATLDQWLLQASPAPPDSAPDSLRSSIRATALLIGLAIFIAAPAAGVITHAIVTRS